MIRALLHVGMVALPVSRQAFAFVVVVVVDDAMRNLTCVSASFSWYAHFSRFRIHKDAHINGLTLHSPVTTLIAYKSRSPYH
jgi:hypothetical protein